MADKTKDKNKNTSKTKVTFRLLVKDSGYGKFNMNFLTVLFALPLILVYQFRIVLLIGLAIVLAIALLNFKAQFTYNKNIKAWNEGLPEHIKLTVDTENGKVQTNDKTFYAKDLMWIKIKPKRTPEQRGVSAIFLTSAFINADLVFELTNGTNISIPIQSKSEIKKIINTFLSLDVKSTFDISVYRACGLK